MAIQLKNTLRNSRADAITTAVGTGGKLKIYSASYATLLATFTWSGNMWGAASNGVVTMLAPTATTVAAAAGGTAAIAKITTSADVDILKDFTVGTSGTEIIIDNTSINSGQNVSLTYGSCTITEANAGF